MMMRSDFWLHLRIIGLVAVTAALAVLYSIVLWHLARSN
jgi:hypothetical protein